MKASQVGQHDPVLSGLTKDADAKPEVALARITAEGPTFLDERQLARMLGLSVLTLQKWRYLRKGPPHQKMGSKAVRYSLAGVLRWLESEPEGRAGDRKEVR